MNNGVNSAKNEGTFTVTDGHNDVWCYIEVPKGLAVDETIYPMIQLASSTDESYEPYTGGKPSPNPDYPQEIKRVVNPVVKVCGKNLVDIYGYSASGMFSPEAERNLFNDYGTTISTTEKTDKLIVNQEIIDGATADNYTSGYFCVGINPKLEDGKNYIITFKINVIQNPFHVSDIIVMFNGIDAYRAQVVGDKVTVKAKYNEFNERQYVEFRIRGMSLEFSNFMIVEVGETDDYEPYTEQSVQLPYTLNAIPVASGGNVTIDGQQWIADYVDVERGKVVRKIGKLILTGEENWMSGFENWTTYPHAFRAEELKKDILKGNTMNAKYTWYQKQANLDLNSMNAPYNRCIAVSDARFSSVNEFTNELKKQDSNGTPLTVCYVTDTPQEENLSLEEIEFLKSLSTYYPVTNISVNSEQLDGYTVFNYPISMANGWNYVKQQLNDNRDYIYDMDIQSAEAYVNSEYAVALTELEV